MLQHKKLFGVIGDPISHSISPYMQDYFIQTFKLKACYHAFRVPPDELQQAIRGARALGFGGLNVTVPHKTAVLPFIDSVDDTARRIGAVNTLHFCEGKITGYNTDVSGFLQNLATENISLQDRHVFILGAGGAARAVAFAAREAGAARIQIYNRTPSRAHELARAVDGQPASLEEIMMMPAEGVVVNATTVGMMPNVEESPLPEELFFANLIYVDLVYNPVQTRFLAFAKKSGARTVDGLGMLIFQGIQALQIWTGRKLDIAPWYAELKRKLEKTIEAMYQNMLFS